MSDTGNHEPMPETSPLATGHIEATGQRGADVPDDDRHPDDEAPDGHAEPRQSPTANIDNGP